MAIIIYVSSLKIISNKNSWNSRIGKYCGRWSPLKFEIVKKNEKFTTKPFYLDAVIWAL